MDVACFSELGRTWANLGFSGNWGDWVSFTTSKIQSATVVPMCSICFCSVGRRKLLRAMARHPEHEPTGPNTTGFTQTPPTWSPVWDHSSSAHLAGHKNTYEDDVVLGLRAEKDGKNTVVVHSCSIKLMVSLCVHLSQGFLHLALLGCYSRIMLYSPNGGCFMIQNALGWPKGIFNIGALHFPCGPPHHGLTIWSSQFHHYVLPAYIRILWFWTRMKGEWLIGSVTRTTNRFTAIYIYLQCIQGVAVLFILLRTKSRDSEGNQSELLMCVGESTWLDIPFLGPWNGHDLSS